MKIAVREGWLMAMLPLMCQGPQGCLRSRGPFGGSPAAERSAPPAPVPPLFQAAQRSRRRIQPSRFRRSVRLSQKPK